MQVITDVLFVVLKHRLVELTSRHRQEVELESERAKQSQSQLEKTQMARERAHKQRVRGLEEQVSSDPTMADRFRLLSKVTEDRRRLIVVPIHTNMEWSFRFAKTQIPISSLISPYFIGIRLH